MTVPKVTGRRRGRFAPHLMPRRPSDAQTLIGALQLLHGGRFSSRLAGLRRVLSARGDAGDAKNEDS